MCGSPGSVYCATKNTTNNHKKYKDSIHNTAHLTLTKPSQNMQNMLSFNHQYEYNYNVFRYI